MDQIWTTEAAVLAGIAVVKSRRRCHSMIPRPTDCRLRPPAENRDPQCPNQGSQAPPAEGGCRLRPFHAPMLTGTRSHRAPARQRPGALPPIRSRLLPPRSARSGSVSSPRVGTGRPRSTGARILRRRPRGGTRAPSGRRTLGRSNRPRPTHDLGGPAYSPDLESGATAREAARIVRHLSGVA